jgi:hypothetical protein
MLMNPIGLLHDASFSKVRSLFSLKSMHEEYGNQRNPKKGTCQNTYILSLPISAHSVTSPIWYNGIAEAGHQTTFGLAKHCHHHVLLG